MNERAENIFFEAHELPDEAVDAYLSGVCGGDDALRREVEQLLADARNAEVYFSGSFGGRDFAKPLPKLRLEKAGEKIGPYELIRELGEGGFGVVWEAQQSKPISRKVALKVIKAGLDTDEVLQRFDAERQALARMDHPHIAKVFDAGATPQGRPFFSMELVDGEPITAFCKTHGLDIKARLALFNQACSAISHAHQKGIIHRDIKPSNVLVATDDRGSPLVKVIDFGVAKAIEGKLTDATLHTRQEQLLGTPAYMSPEQAGLDNLDIDTRSDIYALGVLLYELITGETPFDPSTLMQRGYEEIRRIIREEEPPRPSVRMIVSKSKKTPASDSARMQKSIVGELDWVVMKSMEKNRERRYETAAAFIDDIESYLADKPVTARPPSRGYLLTKFAHRHRTGIRIGSAFICLLVGAVVLSAWLAVRARNAEHLSEERLATALQDRDARDRALDEAEAVTRLLTDVFQRPQPGIDGRSVTVVQALDTAVKTVDDEAASQPERSAVLRNVLADTYERLGAPDRSFPLRVMIFETYKEIYGREHVSTREALSKLIKTAEATGENKAVLKYAQLKIETLRKIDAPFREMAAAMRAEVKGWFGVGERKRAIEAQRDLVDFCRKFYGIDSPQEASANWELRQYEARSKGGAVTGKSDAPNTSLINVVSAELEFGKLMEAHGATNPATIAAQSKLVNSLLNASLTSEALLHLQQVQARSMQVFGPLDDRTLDAQRRLAWLYSKVSRREDGVRVLQAVVDVLRGRDGDIAATTMVAEDKLERALFYARMPEEHNALLDDLLERRQRLLGKDNAKTAQFSYYIASLRYDRDNPEEAIQTIKDAILVLQKEWGNDNRTAADAMAGLARIYGKTERTREALELYSQCGQNMLDDTFVNFNAGALQLWLGDIEGFRKTRRELIRYWSKNLSNGRGTAFQFERALWISCMADADDENQKSELLAFLDHIKNLRASLSVGAYERHTISLQEEIRAMVLYRAGKYQESLEVMDKALQIPTSVDKGESFAYLEHDRKIWGSLFMAMAHHHLGNNDEAKRELDLAETFLPPKHLSKEHPFMGRYANGETIFTWIIRREARALIIGE